MKTRFHLRHAGLALVALAACIVAPTARGDVGPENTVVVVNADSWASLAVANEFIHLRQIPAGNVVYLRSLPNFEQVTVDQFREHMLSPILSALKQRGLSGQIDCIAYSSDVPYAVNVRGDIGENKVPRVITPTAAVNGLTFLYEQVQAKDISYLRLDANHYMRRPQPRVEIEPFHRESQQRVVEAVALIGEKKWADAMMVFRSLIEQHPKQPLLHYNLACCLARLEKTDEALAALKQAVAAGWTNDRHTAADEDLKGLRERADFQALLKEMQQQTFDVQPTAGFRHRYRWSATGEKVENNAGRRFLLSTMLAVTSGRGTSVGEAVAALRRSAAADAARPDGTFYFLTNGDIRARTRQGAFRSAVEQLERLGMRGEIVEGTLPQEKGDVAGAVVGRANFDWPASKSTMLPGAICEHLTSLGGVMRERGGQTPLTEFLRHGAAGSSGTVTEPYAIQAKFPLAFLHVHYARGCTLAEAFYQSVYGPYQLLIVGDPLCRPWAKPPQVKIEGLEAGSTVSGNISVVPAARFSTGDNRAASGFELYVDGALIDTCRPGDSFSLDTRMLADGYHQMTVVAVANDPIETRGRIAVPFLIDNDGGSVRIASPASRRFVFGQPVDLQLVAEGAATITLNQNGRTLATVDGDDGKATIDSQSLGLGRVAIGAEAHDADGKVMGVAPPLLLEITTPSRMAAIALDEKTELAAGLKLTIGDKEPVVVEDTYPRDWLSKLKVEPNTRFHLKATFDAAADDLYQFQYSSNCDVELRIDGQLLPSRRAADWQLLPVALERGSHQFELTGATPAEPPRLQIRFGNRGAQSLDGARFRHPASSVR